VLFHKASEDHEARILAYVGLAIALCVVVATVLAYANPFGGRGEDKIGIVIESPFLGRGIKAGSALLLHGAQVGEVTDVVTYPEGKVRVSADLQRKPAATLTTAMGIDFRPANYFGVTGINLRPNDGGQQLSNGSTFTVTPAGNFTLQALLSRLGEISHGVITPQLVDVVTKSTTYLDGLDPLLETILVVSEALTNVQTVSTARLLANTTGISVAFPGFVNAATTLGEEFHKPLDEFTWEWWDNILDPTLVAVAGSFFGAVGNLLGSHSVELDSLTDMLQVLTDVVPGLVPPDAIADTARELRHRLEQLFSGPPDRRAVSVRVMLNNLPGVAAPLAVQGAIP
jgi:hypothetical protein